MRTLLSILYIVVCWLDFPGVLIILFYSVLGLPGGASSKEPVCQFRRCKRCRFEPWVGKVPWRRKWWPAPAFLPGKAHGQRSLAGYSSWRCKKSGVTEWLSNNELFYFKNAACDLLNCSHDPLVVETPRLKDWIMPSSKCPDLNIHNLSFT